MDRQLVPVSKFLSLVLRHQPEAIGIVLDAHGWVPISELIDAAARHGILSFKKRCLANRTRSGAVYSIPRRVNAMSKMDGGFACSSTRRANALHKLRLRLRLGLRLRAKWR